MVKFKLNIILVLFLSLCSAANAVMGFMHFSASAINQAMGYGYVGVADVWHQNPLLAYDNPALPAMHDGIAYGMVRDEFLDIDSSKPMFNNSGMLTIGFKGIGVSLPAINPYGNFGTFFDYRTMMITSEEEFGPVDSFHFYESTRSYGISFNPLKYKRETDADYADKYAWLDVSAGLTYSRVYSNLYAPIETNNTWEMKENILELGLLALARKQVGSLLMFEGSLGFRKYNLTNAVVEMNDSLASIPFGQNNIFGAGASVSIPLSVVKISQLSGWVENLISVRALGDRNISHDFGGSTSYGMEIGMLDTIFLRKGYYDENAGIWSGQTSGFGLNLHYRDLCTLEYNSAEFPNANWPGNQHSWDMMLQVDGIKLLQAMKK